MSNLSRKFVEYFEIVLKKYSDHISNLLYERDKHLFNDDLSDSRGFKKSTMKNLYKDIVDDLIFNQVSLDEMTDEYKAMCISMSVSHKTNYEVPEDKLRQILKKYNRCVEDYQYADSANKICTYLNYCISNDVTKEPDITIRKLCRKVDYYICISNSLEETLEETNVFLSVRFSDILRELEMYNIKSRDLYTVLKVFFIKILRAKKLYESDELEFESNESVDYYLEIFDLINKFEIYDFEKLETNKFSELLKELGVSEKRIKEIINYRENKQSSDDNYIISIDSGLKKYEEKKELHGRLRQNLLEYFDLKDMHLKRFLNREETNKVLSILKELGYGEEIIRKFIWDNDTLFPGQDFVVRCEYILGRAKFYSSAYGFEKEYNDFEDYYNRYLEAEDEEDKEFHYELLGISYNEIMSFLKSIPKTYEYELSMKKQNFKLILKDK